MNMKLIEMHRTVVDEYKKNYDSSVSMLTEYRGLDYGYHSKLNNMTVHSVSKSTDFAIALLDTGRKEDISVAEKILMKVMSLQDKRKDKDTFGLWPYFLEESIDEMSPPDWNMAAFNGMALLQAYIDYRDVIKPEIVNAIKQACIDASECIIKRNVIVTYTNIAAMSSYVTIVTGELFDDKMKCYGKTFFEKFYYHIKNNGCIDEYNSPTYSALLARIFGIMLQHVQDERLHKMVEDLNDMTWKMISEHFHPNMGEWVGPHFRAYSDFASDQVKTMIETALDFKIDIAEKKSLSLNDIRYEPKCPEKYKQAFIEGNKCYSIRKMISAGRNYPYFSHSNGEMSYITPKYAIASFERVPFWNQHRPVTMYIGNKENKCCLRLRVLHDFYDYSSAFASVAQFENALITQINYLVDGGDRHTVLDPIKNGTIHANDFRVRVQVTGHHENARITHEGDNALIEVNGVKIRCGFSYMLLGDYKVRYEVNSDENGVYFDAVLVDKETDISFTDMKDAAAIFYMIVDSENYTVPKSKTEDDTLITDWEAEGNKYHLTTYKAPNKYLETIMKHRQYINGVWTETLEAEQPLG